jgi:periplasmic divalent cation tolerance protein
MDVVMVYMTAGSLGEARKIALELVSQRLVACANIIEGVHSCYWWEGKVQEEGETVIIAKTKKELFPMLVERVRSIHSYICPCIVALPLVDGYDPFLSWVRRETQDLC